MRGREEEEEEGATHHQDQTRGGHTSVRHVVPLVSDRLLESAIMTSNVLVRDCRYGIDCRYSIARYIPQEWLLRSFPKIKTAGTDSNPTIPCAFKHKLSCPLT